MVQISLSLQKKSIYNIMKKNKRKRIDENIMMFEEWKDSEDYLIQSWFFATDKKIRLWFEDNVLNGFEFDDFQWTPSDTYLIYTGHLEFKEKTIEYKLDLILEQIGRASCRERV